MIATRATSIPPASTVTVDVYNGGGVRGLAGQDPQALAALGYKADAAVTVAPNAKYGIPCVY